MLSAWHYNLDCYVCGVDLPRMGETSMAEQRHRELVCPSLLSRSVADSDPGSQFSSLLTGSHYFW